MDTEYREITGGSNDRLNIYYENSSGGDQATGTTQKTYCFAIVAILGLGGLVVAAVGLAQFVQAGALTNQAIIMMAAGGGGGLIFFIMGTIGAVKIGAVKNQVGSIYGPEAWPELGQKWGCKLEVLDEDIPEAPKEEVANGRVRIYIPKRVKVDGEEKELTLKNLKEIKNSKISCTSTVLDEVGDETAFGWVDIDSGMIPDSQSKHYEHQNGMVEEGCRLPKTLEAVVLNVMVFGLTGQKLYGKNTFTRCSDLVSKEKLPVIVGDFQNSLWVMCGGTDSQMTQGVVSVCELSRN